MMAFGQSYDMFHVKNADYYLRKLSFCSAFKHCRAVLQACFFVRLFFITVCLLSNALVSVKV